MIKNFLIIYMYIFQSLINIISNKNLVDLIECNLNY